MDKPEPLEQWVNQRMLVAGLPTEWPDLAAGRRRLDQRLSRQAPPLLIWFGVSAAACAVLLALPGSRAVAQRLWDQVILGRIQVLTTDYDQDGGVASAFSPEVQHQPDFQSARSLEEASRLAGFSPRLPGSQLLAASPRYSVSDVLSATLRLRTPAIRYLVARAGGDVSQVPASWNGVVLDVRIGPVVMADYDGTLLLQSPAFRLIAPPDFDLALFYRIAFRSLGMSEADASLLSDDLSMSPALLTFMPKEDRQLLHEFKTARGGTGMTIDEVYGAGKTTALWTGADRVYALFGDKATLTDDFVIKVADALE
jgi:hypothetical protein